MSKVGESIIKGAKEALEFAQSDDSSCEGNVLIPMYQKARVRFIRLGKELKIE